MSAIGRALLDACLLDVTALKPGNVGLHASGHGMQPAQFIRSAEAATGALVRGGTGVGERILRAVGATQRAVGLNTNLGIVLLAAPLVHAAASLVGAPNRDTLTLRLREVLAGLSVEDAQQAFEAIRLARPGGLGASARHDVNAPARVSLLAAMREAATRDMIAAQYANGYADILETGLGRLAAARARGRDWRWTMTEVYLAFLARHPDSHIERKFGASQARAVREAAMEYDRATALASCPATLTHVLSGWDASLKAGGLNPGTSADLAVTTLFFAFLCEAHLEVYRPGGSRRGAGAAVGARPTGSMASTTKGATPSWQ